MKISRQCRGTVKETGKRCRVAPLVGQTVCYRHGGNTQQALKAARMRLLAACEPAIMVLLRVVGNDRASDSDRINAAKAIMDRGGLPAGVNIQALVEHRVGWEEDLRKLFFNGPPKIEARPSDIDGEVVEDTPLVRLTEAFEARGFTDRGDRRGFAERTLGRPVDSAQELSERDIDALIKVLESEAPEPLPAGDDMPYVVSPPPKRPRAEPSDERLPRYVTDRERAGTSRTLGRYS